MTRDILIISQLSSWQGSQASDHRCLVIFRTIRIVGHLVDICFWFLWGKVQRPEILFRAALLNGLIVEACMISENFNYLFEFILFILFYYSSHILIYYSYIEQQIYRPRVSASRSCYMSKCM